MRPVIVALLLSAAACSHVKYIAKSDSTEVEWNSFGTDKAINDALFTTSPDGTRQLRVGAYGANQTEALRLINQGLQMLVEGAAKGAAP